MLPLVILAIEDENEKAFMTWLYLQYRRLIYSEVRKIVGNTDEAEDLLQSVVEKLIEKVSLLRGDGAKQAGKLHYLHGKEHRVQLPSEEGTGNFVGGPRRACRSGTYAGGTYPRAGGPVPFGPGVD